MVTKPALRPKAMLLLPVVLLESAELRWPCYCCRLCCYRARNTVGRVAAGSVALERLITVGRVLVAGGVAKEAKPTVAVLSKPVVLLKSAP